MSDFQNSQDSRAKDLKIKLAQMVTQSGPDPLLHALSELAWERSQPGLPHSGQWRRIFIAMQEVLVASQSGNDPLQ